MSEQLHFYLEKLQEHFGMHLPALLKAILILVVGWLVARIIAALVRGALTRTDLDNRIANWI